MSAERQIRHLEIDAQSNAYRWQILRRLVHARDALQWSKARCTINWCGEKQYKRIAEAERLVQECLDEINEKIEV